MGAGHLDMVECDRLILPLRHLHTLKRELDVLGIEFADDLVGRAIIPHDAGFQFEVDGLGVGLFDRTDELARFPAPGVATGEVGQTCQAGVLQDHLETADHVTRIGR